MSSSIFTVKINSKTFLWTLRSVQETYPNFRPRPMLGKPSTPLCRLADRHESKASLDWKL